MQYPFVYYLFYIARLLLPVVAVACIFIIRSFQTYREACLFTLYVLGLIAVVPILVDFLMAWIMTNKKANPFLNADMYFEEQRILLSGAKENRSYFYGSIVNILCSVKDEAYYLLLEAKVNGKTEEKVSYILPVRCFIEGDPAAFGAFIFEKTGLECKEIH